MAVWVQQWKIRILLQKSNDRSFIIISYFELINLKITQGFKKQLNQTNVSDTGCFIKIVLSIENENKFTEEKKIFGNIRVGILALASALAKDSNTNVVF